MNDNKMNRRHFMRNLAIGAAAFGAPMVLPSTVLGRGTRPAPSGRITLGLIGCGGMGLIDLYNFIALPDVEVLAVCDVDANHRDNAIRLLTQEAAKKGLPAPKVDAYNDFEELLARPDIDAVAIVVPDHWHAGIGIAAAKAGKDIYGEKPLARTIREGRNMVRVIERHGTVFQMGTQSRSHGPIQDVIDLLHFGAIGNIQRIELNLPQYGGWGPVESEEPPPNLDYERWLGPAPWRPYRRIAVHSNFRTVLDYSGGTITDHGTHRLDVSAWGAGVDHTGPVRIEGTAQYPQDGPFDAPTIARFELKYANGLTMHCHTEPDTSQWGTRFIGDEGWIMVPMEAPLPHLPITASDPRILSMRVPPEKRVAYRSANHWANFIECCKTRGRPAQTIQIGHRSTSLCHLANIAMELDRPVDWDPEKEIFPNDPQANAKLDRPKRQPWARFFDV